MLLVFEFEEETAGDTTSGDEFAEREIFERFAELNLGDEILLFVVELAEAIGKEGRNAVSHARSELVDPTGFRYVEKERTIQFGNADIGRGKTGGYQQLVNICGITPPPLFTG